MAEPVRTIGPGNRDEVLLRLRRIEGQARGIQRMVEDGRDCREIVMQIAAIKSALNSVTALVLECYAQGCLGSGELPREETVAELIEVMLKAAR